MEDGRQEHGKAAFRWRVILHLSHDAVLINCLIMTKYLIGVDLGTTSTKAVAFSISGKVLFSASTSYPTLKPKPSWSEQDPFTILNAVVKSIRTVTDSQRKNELLAISFSSAMHGLIALDKRGRKLDQLHYLGGFPKQ